VTFPTKECHVEARLEAAQAYKTVMLMLYRKHLLWHRQK